MHPIAIRPTEAAVENLLAFRGEADEIRAQGGKVAPLWARAYENALRVAGVVAAGSWNPTSGEQPELHGNVAEWSINLVRASVERTARLVRDEVADSETERDIKKIVSFVRERREVTRSQLTRQFQRIEKWRREQLIQTALEAGLIIESQFNTDVERGPTVYRPGLVDD
jgi:hypothetical protein